MSQYDIVIIGAGINGAGVAQAAAAQGYKVLVLEKNRSVGLETSSASSKLIHGGLRYLETLEFSLVRESLHERELLLKLAPELVKRQRFNIPIYKETSRNQLTLHAGLSLYALLAGLNRHSFYHQVPFKQWDRLDGLTTDRLITVFQYQDAQTDDRALTRAVMASARQLGAELACNACFLQAQQSVGEIHIDYRQQGEERQTSCRVLVNAAGPWVYPLNQRISPTPALQQPDLIQGAHLQLDEAVHQAYYLEAPQDWRAVFLLPWKGRALLGTTETRLDKDADKFQVTAQERDYLLTVFHHYFPYQEGRIIGEMAGVRVLAHSDKKVFKRSRDVSLHVDNHTKPGIVTIVGGKLTVYRRTALKVLALLQASLPDARPLADTANLSLTPVDDNELQ